MEMLSKNKALIADIVLLGVAMIWGVGFVATKNALDDIAPLYLIALRFWIAFFILVVIFVKKLKYITLLDIKGGVIVGIFLYMGFATQTIGMQFTSVGKSAFLTGTNVVMVPFLYWMLFKEKPDKFSIIAAVICFIGITILTLDESVNSIGLGDSLTLLCALFFACHIISIGFYVKKIDMSILTVIQFLVVAILSTVTAVFYEKIPYNISVNSWLSILFLGVFGTCMAFFLQTVAQKYTYSTHVAIILSMESVFGIIFSMMFLKENFSIRMFLGCIAILFAIITAETRWEFIWNKTGSNVDASLE
ncbi:DMT family transporter [Tepidibacter thalassicus]|uniref:Permease of the drug/metabolite transporter (DMT) superfamily n=1 Tax=Tepidibacter thalassicus DSM 15285 TaxID=1123350 RepID=A0A1M5PMB7_9FIRM|nr:DMT family transporter [Tepidibacter thalassicus]SHH02857.1 Permease of the drug/metabolite transporter (DMT) superfamily [Tepidibacter thalassicus DSM 15285]